MMRWNALAMVVRANRRRLGELGGHIASYASAADLFEVGFNHFFRARETRGGAATSSISSRIGARRLCACLPRRAALGDARHYRQEIAPGKAAGSAPIRIRGRCRTSGSSRPARWASGRSTRSTRRASCATSSTAACRRPAGRARGLGLLRRRRDGRTGVHRRALARRARAARQLHLRHQLQPAAPRWSGARQRPHRRRAGVAVPRRRLERDKCLWGSDWDVLFARDHSHADARVRARPSTASSRPSRPTTARFNRELLRPEPGAAALVAICPMRTSTPAPRRPRRREDPRRVRAAPRAQGPADRDPRQDDEGLRHGRGGAGAHDDAPAEEARCAGLLAFRDRFACR